MGLLVFLHIVPPRAILKASDQFLFLAQDWGRPHIRIGFVDRHLAAVEVELRESRAAGVPAARSRSRQRTAHASARRIPVAATSRTYAAKDRIGPSRRFEKTTNLIDARRVLLALGLCGRRGKLGDVASNKSRVDRIGVRRYVPD